MLETDDLESLRRLVKDTARQELMLRFESVAADTKADGSPPALQLLT